MAPSAKLQLSAFALDIAEGLSQAEQKKLSPRFFYDDLGSALFEAITLLPEYGLTRADERILRRHAVELPDFTGAINLVAELGSGSGRKTANVLSALSQRSGKLIYRPIDVSSSALAACQKELAEVAEVGAVCADWIEGLQQVVASRNSTGPMLLLFLGSSIGNLERGAIKQFLERVRSLLRLGDFFLLGADLVKDIDTMISAYDDPVGVTAAFNLNLLNRINRELGANFDLRSFTHEIRWNAHARRIEMHLVSSRNQRVFVDALDTAYFFEAGETIWTESSHKFTESELSEYARSTGFGTVKTWTDIEWPLAETLWKAH